LADPGFATLSFAACGVLSFAAADLAPVWAAGFVWSVGSAGLPSPASGWPADAPLPRDWGLSLAGSGLAALSFAACGGLSVGMRSSLLGRLCRLPGNPGPQDDHLIVAENPPNSDCSADGHTSSRFFTAKRARISHSRSLSIGSGEFSPETRPFCMLRCRQSQTPSSIPPRATAIRALTRPGGGFPRPTRLTHYMG